MVVMRVAAVAMCQMNLHHLEETGDRQCAVVVALKASVFKSSKTVLKSVRLFRTEGPMAFTARRSELLLPDAPWGLRDTTKQAAARRGSPPTRSG